MKRIGIFSAHYLPSMGGVENYTDNLAKALIKRGVEVVVVTSSHPNAANYEERDGILVYRLPCYNLLAGRFPISKVNREYRQLYKELMELSFDLVIVQTRFYWHSIAGVRFAKKQKCKSIIIDHGTSHMTIGSKFWDTVGGWYEHLITALAKRYCKDYYGVSLDCCRWLEHFGIKARGVLYNAIDDEQIQALMKQAGRDFRKEFKVADETVIITYTGRLVKEKGIMNLIEAVKQYQGQQQICLMIAGKGEEMANVQAAASERIIPLGRLSFEDIVALLKQSQIFCLPTNYPEGFPTSTLEAISAGCYIITTTRGGAQELLIDESYGILMKDNAVETICSSIEQAMVLGEEREEAINRAHERVLNNFTWDIISQKIYELLD